MSDGPIIEEENKQQEEVQGEDNHHDHHDHDDNCGHDHDDNLNSGKGEKKIRKALLKLGLNKIEGVNRVTIRQKENYHFIVKDPEVYVSKESESSYVIFGEITMEDEKGDLAGNQALSNIQQDHGSVAPETNKEKVEIVEDEDENAEVSEEGLDKESIDMVISETKASRQKVVKALKKNKGDVVSTILELNN